MNGGALVILITFIESISGTAVVRGLLFFSVERLDFSRQLNLTLTVVCGITYVAAAFASHALCQRLGERRLLRAGLLVQLVNLLILAQWASPVLLFVCSPLLWLVNGLKWPIIESYVAAGLAPRQSARAIGSFNLSWATGVPLAMLVIGPLIKLSPSALFILPAALSIVNLALTSSLGKGLVHLAADHPERPASQEMGQLKALLVSSRWMLLLSFASMWVLAAIMPHIFKQIGYVVAGPALAGVLEAAKLAAFIGLWWWRGWFGSANLLILSLVLMPVGFFMVLFGGNLTVVLVGELLFGVCSGLIYYGALYYAMIVKNASVAAGAVHEGLIGMGLAIGPAAGLLGLKLAGVFGNEVYGMLIAVGPMFVICSAAAAWAIRGLIISRLRPELSHEACREIGK